jgi:predicted regulator of Ras-like GTPase activity (Roadblock/LC7/MglB family)
MPTIRDVVEVLASRDGVEAVVVLTRDGLLIDSSTRDGVDADGLAALVPAVVRNCRELGAAAGRGGFGTSVMEYEGGLALVAEISGDALLAMVFRAGTNVGSLLYELRRHRASIATLL